MNKYLKSMHAYPLYTRKYLCMHVCVYISTSIWRDCWNSFDSAHSSNDQTSDLYLSNGSFIELQIFQHPIILYALIYVFICLSMYFTGFLLVHYTLSLFPLFSPSLHPPPSCLFLSLSDHPFFSLISNFWLFLSQFLDRLDRGSINLSNIRQQNSRR